MSETPPFNPERRDRMSHDNPLLAAADRLARAVAEIEPNSDYAPVAPRAMIVGGYVRDKMLGLDPKDADLEVFGVDPAVLKALCEKLFGKAKDAGVDFNMLKVSIGNGLELDVSIPRREKKIGDGHSDFLVDSDPSLGLKEASSRRDFTVNAMMEDPLTGVVFDPHGGLEDMKSKTLRVTDPERFVEDPLRVLRAMQFAARLGFSVEPKSAELMRRMVADGMVSHLKAERVTGEIEKLLTKGKAPSVGLAFGKEIGVIGRILPELEEEEICWKHVLLSVDAAALVVREKDRGLSEAQMRQAMLAAMVLPIDEASARRLFSRLKFPKDDVDVAMRSLGLRSEPARLQFARKSGSLTDRQYANEVRKLVRAVGKGSWRVLLAVSEIETPGVTDQFASTVVEFATDTDGMKPLLAGQDLMTTFGLKPGKHIGETMALIEAARDADQILTKDDAIAFVRDLMK